MEDNHITDERARSFVAPLRRFEQDADPAPLAALSADRASLSRLDARGERTDAAAFWPGYRDQFHRLTTGFVNTVDGGGLVAPERTTATLTDDRPLPHRGVLDLGDDAVVALHTSDDSAASTPIPARVVWAR
ncbi:hypothetical protein [Pseudonocardia hydrocarbonoxydans]|uniref:Uncharacterized protein n=1 Tax=Pseudonocardia hydrocarbonoxydans TaxID=76726 RepID=A0A4Y3WRH4_9PSEU|nr:hypothetical protein [Pseudonocardia hydrocarbonoxydans]GEC21384.1 hypothetical protein PHY01_36670 [Pseudonocardia hydrocarbonoxydans]